MKYLIPAVLTTCLFCTQPPSVEEAKNNPNWYVDTTRDWSEHLTCPDASGCAYFVSDEGMPFPRSYTNVVYVLERRGKYWVGYALLDRTGTANLSSRSWSLDSAYCTGE